MAIAAVTPAELAAGPHATDDPAERAGRQERLQLAESTFDAIPFDAIPFDAIPFDAIPFDAIPFDAIPFDGASPEPTVGSLRRSPPRDERTRPACAGPVDRRDRARRRPPPVHPQP
ncbi:MAG: hypothetical protein ACRDLA_15705, partial [Thermoleophilaceae bacterium]